MSEPQNLWLAGARPRTFPNAIAPVLVGTGAAAAAGGAVWWKALLAMIVALGLIVAVNYFNDYSDGIRGTDDDRVGPLRLVGSGLKTPAQVRNAALIALGIAGVTGIALSLTSAWWLVLIGLFCAVGAWFYTGGKHPYGYLGLGEVAVFVFFGLIAVLGTQYVQRVDDDGSITAAGVIAACAVGAFSSAVLVANNLRDIPTDRESGKVTLAVRLGDAGTRRMHLVLVAVPLLLSVVLAAMTSWWLLLGVAAAPLIAKANAPVRTGATGLGLIPALAGTGIAMLAWSVLTTVGFFLA